MSYFSLVKAHEGIVYLFLILFVVKSFLFLSNKKELFEKVRAKTKVLEMILGTLLLASGVYLVVMRETVETWVIIKTIVVLIAIPLTIVGFKKENKALVGLAILGFLGIFFVMNMKLHV